MFKSEGKRSRRMSFVGRLFLSQRVLYCKVWLYSDSPPLRTYLLRLSWVSYYFSLLDIVLHASGMTVVGLVLWECWASSSTGFCVGCVLVAFAAVLSCALLVSMSVVASMTAASNFFFKQMSPFLSKTNSTLIIIYYYCHFMWAKAKWWYAN